MSRMLPGLSDQQIDEIAGQIMNGPEFRSVRRRVLENDFSGADPDKGFLKTVLSSVGDGLSWVMDTVFGFLGELLSGLSRLPGRGGANATPPPNSDPVSSGAAAANGLDALSRLLTILAVIGILLILISIVAVIVRAVDKRRKGRIGLLEDGTEDPAMLAVPPGELAALTYEGRAIQLAADGNYRAAVRELLMGSMSWIERSGLIRYRRGLTNRDYVRAIWRRTEKRQAYAVTALEFERICFGRREATRQAFEKCLSSFQGAFREEEKPLAAV